MRSQLRQNFIADYNDLDHSIIFNTLSSKFLNWPVIFSDCREGYYRNYFALVFVQEQILARRTDLWRCFPELQVQFAGRSTRTLRYCCQILYWVLLVEPRSRCCSWRYNSIWSIF